MKRCVPLAAALLASCATAPDPISPGTTMDWQAGPIISGHNYSPAVSIASAPGAVIAFDIPADAAGVHYVTEPTGSLAGKSEIVIRYRVDANPGVSIHGVGCTSPSAVTAYFQRSGDGDMSGVGIYETFRWWATFVSKPLSGPGQWEIDAPLSGRWTAVETSNSIDQAAAFKAALANASRVGFTFANCTGYGHGAVATGPARFTLLGFEVR